MANLTVFPDSASFVDGAADFIAELAVSAVSERGRFTIALSGGGTPRAIDARLATPGFRNRLDWSKVQVFFSDERCVPPDDARSNFRMEHEALLAHVPLPTDNLHRIRGEDAPAQAALMYEQELSDVFRTSSAPHLRPRLPRHG
jgi:6-phosphogluconolactonase